MQSPIALTMIFAMKEGKPPIFSYHGSKDIKVLKSENEYSFESDFGNLVFNNKSYCAWRIEIKEPVEH